MPRRKTHDEFVSEMEQTHPNLRVIGEYKGDKEYVDVYCVIHNYIFPTKPNWLHHGSNCKFCYNDRRGDSLRKPIQQLLKEMNEKHNNKYKYPNLENEYKNNKSRITILCPIHGEFPQTVNHHLQGQGCWKCNQSHLEKSIEDILIENSIEFIPQYHNFDIIGYKSVDFFLPKYNVVIECQGEQHFIENEFFGGKDTLNETVRRDVAKFNELKQNGIKAIYVLNKKFKQYSLNDQFCGIYNTNRVFTIEEINENSTNFISELSKI